MRHMHKPGRLLMLLGACLLLTACAGIFQEEEAALTPPEPQPELTRITVTAGDTQLQGVLFDNETARGLASLLPLEVPVWNPAPGFAKALDLEEHLPDAPEHTRWYELGGLAYWDEGPSVAIFYSDHLDRTVVPVTTIGRLEGDVRLLEPYSNSLRIDAVSSVE